MDMQAYSCGGHDTAIDWEMMIELLIWRQQLAGYDKIYLSDPIQYFQQANVLINQKQNLIASAIRYMYTGILVYLFFKCLKK